jgi:diguanylate cyclase (GGDEF)-like protein/PAS domain S-box-containing protein
LRDVEHVASMGSFEWDIRSNTLSWSEELDRIYGLTPGEQPQTFEGFLQRVHPDDREAVRQNVARTAQTGVGWSMDERIIRADTGETRVLASRVKPMRNGAGEIVRLCGTCQDVTEQRHAEQALAVSEARFRRGFDDAPIGMLLLEMRNADTFITRSNKAMTYLLGYTKAQLAKMRLSQIVDAHDWPLLYAVLDRVVQERIAPMQLEVRLQGRNGAKPIALAAASRIAGDERASALILHLEDITVRKHAEEQLRHRALHDPLTGLPNRDLLLDRLQGALSRASREHVCVAALFLDIDNFKIINDTVGHVAGDEILRTIANRLTSSARSGDTCARVGGDEFVVICEHVAHDDEVFSLAQRVAEVVGAPIHIDGQEFVANVSIGIAVGRDTRASEQLLRDADLAMYRAKQRGKNTIEVFDETLRRHAMDRVEVERELRRALTECEIYPHYQPIIALETGKTAGFEALARWRHPARGILYPQQFLSVAEDAHLIGTLGAVMFEQACHQLAQWQRDVPDLTMAVNLSLRQLDGSFTPLLEQLLRRYAIPPHTLHIEVTESVLIDMQKSAAAHLRSLSALGVRLGIDDFGTGYSSLLYLKRFPVGFLKIDRSFVDGLPDNQEDTAIVEAIIGLGRSLELSTIAEGVETDEQLQTLQKLGCTYAQGNYIAEPLPAPECRIR